MTLTKIFYILSRGPLDVEVIGFSLSRHVQWLYVFNEKKANRKKFNNIVRQCAIHVVGMIKVCPLRNTEGYTTTTLFNGNVRTTA